MRWKLPVAVVVLAAAGGAIYVNKEARSRVLETIKHVSSSEARADSGRRPPTSREAQKPWDGLVPVDSLQEKTIGLKTVKVVPQTEATTLELVGTTDYDPNTLSQVRPRFPSRIEAVHTDPGKEVKMGDALVDVYSNTLAAAKNDYDKDRSQWMHDKSVLDRNMPLEQSGAVSKKDMENYRNEERKSRLEYEQAHNQLLIMGLTEEDIENSKKESGTQRGKMTLRAPASGIVIMRDAVPGNMYDDKDILLTIAPLDHLWVWGNVFEGNSDKVKLEQNVAVTFLSVEDRFSGKVEYIDPQVNPETRAVRFRFQIPNKSRRLKKGMFARVSLKIPPTEGRIVIPRIAMVSSDNTSFVFVKKTVSGSSERPDSFERRPIRVVQENQDSVIVDKSDKPGVNLSPGEEVVSVGSIMLEQLFEDLNTVNNGTPL